MYTLKREEKISLLEISQKVLFCFFKGLIKKNKNACMSCRYIYIYMIMAEKESKNITNNLYK
jgi:predicted transcriptional regulator